MKFELGQKIIDKMRGKSISHNQKAVDKWFKDDGENTLRLNYNLNPDSIIFDVGGYVGDFTAKIYEKYQSKIYIFEPVQSFYDKISKRFENNPKIFINKFGLSNKTQDIEIELNQDASSVYTHQASEAEIVKLVDIKEFLDNNIKNIDLLKINIEGGEYPLLERLIEIDFIKNINNIQVQFHHLDENCKQRMEKIQKEIAKTHKLTYQYAWCWENWEKKQ